MFQIARSVLCLSLACSSALAAIPDPEPAPTQSIMVILDSSGTMALRIHGRPKRVMAQRALRDLVTDLPADIDVGLIAFGHGTEKRCDDIEVVVPLGGADRQRILSAASGLQARGRSPIAGALRLGARALYDRPGTRTIVLLSDGSESCEEDVCSQAAKLQQLGIDLNLHVIGLDVGRSAGEDLACLAAESDGRYHATHDEAELLASFAAIRRELCGLPPAAPDSAPAVTVKETEEPEACDGDGHTCDGWSIHGDADIVDAGDVRGNGLSAVDRRNKRTWYWQLPECLVERVSRTYGGRLRFELKVSRTDRSYHAEDLLLVSADTTLALDVNDDPQTTWTAYSIHLTTRSEWVDIDTGDEVSEQELRDVLADLEAVRIRGEYRSGADTGWIRDVEVEPARRR